MPDTTETTYVGDENVFENILPKEGILKFFPELLNETNVNISGNGTVTQTAKDTAACILFKFILYTVAMGILCILGFIGNTLSFLVLRKDTSTPVASFLLEALAIADNALLILWLIHYSIRESFQYFGLDSNFHSAWMYVRVYTFPVMYMAQTATIWLTVVIALNRYMAVCLPYRAPHLCNINNVYKEVAIVTLFSICYNLPRFFEIHVLHQTTGNATATKWVRTALGNNPVYSVVYVDVLYYLFSFVLPLLILAFVNTSVTIAYQAIRQRKRRMTSRRQENENNITLVMIIIVLVFMLCQAPARIVQLVWRYIYEHCETYQFYLIHVSNTLEVLNSSINFVIYFMFRKRFRDIVWAHYCCDPVVSRLRKSEAHPSTTTEGLYLVQVEQSTVLPDITACTRLAQEEYEDTNAYESDNKQPLNGNCKTSPVLAGESNIPGEVEADDNGVQHPEMPDTQEDLLEHVDGSTVPLRP